MMTRFLRMSLSVIAILLVAVMALSSCSDGKTAELEGKVDSVGKEVERAQAAADEAKAQTATNLAAAKQEVAEAKASLEAAIAKKADTTTLTEEVAKLAAAVKAAEKASADADAGLNDAVEALDAAIEAAKATLTTNAQALVSALDADVTAALNAKADTATVNAKLAALNSMIENINSATSGAVDASTFLTLSTTVASYAYDLETRKDAVMAYAALYTVEQVANIRRAYVEASVVMYRATNVTILTEAREKFEEALVANSNIVDKFAQMLEAYGDGNYAGADEIYAAVTGTTGQKASAESICDAMIAYYEDAETTDLAKELVKNYYGQGNLLADALELYYGEFVATLAEINDRYLVYPEHVEYTDADDLAAVEAAMAEYEAALAKVDGFLGTASTLTISAQAKAKLDQQKAWMVVLGTAKADAEAATGLKPTFAASEVALEKTKVDKINEFNTAVTAWRQKYIKPAQDKDAARKAANESLITATEAVLAEYVAELTKLADSYKADAMKFQILLSAFYADEYVVSWDEYEAAVEAKNTAKIAELKASLQTCDGIDATKVNLLSAGAINEIFTEYTVWSNKYKLDLNLTYETVEKKPADSMVEYTELKGIYDAKIAEARAAYEAQVTPLADDKVADVTIYTNEDYVGALAWFTNYAAKDADGNILWDTVKDAENKLVDGYDLGLGKIATKADYDNLNALKAAVEAKIAEQAEKAAALQAKINAVVINTLTYTDADKKLIADLEAEYTAYITNGAENPYDPAQTALNTARKYNVDNTHLVDARAELTTLKNLYEAIAPKVTELTNKNNATNTAVPYIENDAFATDFEAKADAVTEAIKNFTDRNGDKLDPDEAGAIAEAKKLVATAEKKLKVYEVSKRFDTVADAAIAHVDTLGLTTEAATALKQQITGYYTQHLNYLADNYADLDFTSAGIENIVDNFKTTINRDIFVKGGYAPVA